MEDAPMEVFEYPQFSRHLSRVFVALFTHVSNAPEIRSRIISAATMTGDAGEEERERLNFAFIDPKAITTREHLLAAIYVALVAASNDSLTTKTVHSEILWALNYSNNITESIKRFGINNSSSAVIVVRIGSYRSAGGEQAPLSEADVGGLMQGAVTGQRASLHKISELTDLSLVKKYYKLNSDPVFAQLRQDAASASGPLALKERAVIDELVTSSVAMKTVLA